MRRHRPCDLEETPVAKTPRLTDDGSDESDLSFLDASSDSLASSDSFLSSLTDSYSEEEETDELRQPLYAGANITALQSCVAMLQYKFRYSLSKKAFEELVSLIALHLPQDVQLKQSITTIRKHIDELFNDVAAKKHCYCTTCSQLLGDGEKCSDCVDAKVGTFLQVPLEPQLKRRLEDPKLWDAIQERFVNNPTARLSDVYDGECYKKYCDQGGFLSADNPANISLLMNTDGVAIFRSSTTSMWPMWIVINELPPTLRFAKSNMLLGGIWYSAEKPTMNTYLKPFIDSLNKLYTTGFQVETPAGQLTCRVAMLMSAVDLPARAIMANMKQFNGHYSCSWCEIEGISPPNLPMVSYFPYPLHKPTPRTNLRILVNAATATKENKSELGIKGPSILALHRPFDLATGFVVDALHCVFLGITKQLLSYWFSPKHAKKDCSIRKKLKICEKKLAAIRVPNFISRTPHLLEDFHTWKASECRSWILYYSIPVLKDVLPTPYIDHHALLVTSMHISYSDKITQQDLVLLKELLGKFYRQFTDLYGDFTATMNAHLLSHIPECVSKWGPLWAYSCFPFEGMNHALKLLFHGTRDMSYELATSYTLAQLLPTLTAISESKNIKSYIEKLYNNELSRDKQVAVKPLGRPDSIIPDGTIRQELSTLVDVPTGCIQSYKRVSLHGVTYTSTSYRRSVKRCDYAVQYAGHYGLVERYLLVREQLFAVVQTYSQQRSSQLSQHIVNCLPAVPHCRVVVSVHDIFVKCCFMDVGTDTVYFVCPPNKLRFD